MSSAKKKRQKVTSDSAYSLTIIIYPSPYFPSPPIVSTNSLYLSHSLSPICPPLILSPNSLFPSHPLSSITSPLILLSYCLPSHFSPSIQPSHFPSLPLSLPAPSSIPTSLPPSSPLPPFLGKKEEEGEDLISGANLRTLDSSDVASLLVEQLKEEKLTLLSEKNLAEALTEFVDKEEKEAISE